MNNKILTEILKELKTKFKENLISVILFGSQARGLSTENSDIDLIVVIKELPADLLKRNEELRAMRLKFLIRYGKRLDLHLFDCQEIIDNFKACSPIFSTLILGSQILYDKKNFFKKCYLAFIKILIKSDIIYCEGGKEWRLSQSAQGIASV